MTNSWRWSVLAALVVGSLSLAQCAGSKGVTVSVALGVPARAPDARSLPPMPTPRPAPRVSSEPGLLGSEEHVSIIVVTDGRVPDEEGENGLACMAEVRGRSILFAAGPLPEGLDRRLRTVNRSLDRVQLLIAADQAGAAGVAGLAAESEIQVRVVIPAGTLEGLAAEGRFEEAAASLEVSPEVFVTGLVSPVSATQAMAIRTRAGWIAVTGCTGPATDEVVQRIHDTLGSPVVWVVGGVHTGSRQDQAAAEALAEHLHAAGVRRMAVAPCTSDRVRASLRQVMGAALLEIQPAAVALFKP